jgi:hypothetical protein
MGLTLPVTNWNTVRSLHLQLGAAGSTFCTLSLQASHVDAQNDKLRYDCVNNVF